MLSPNSLRRAEAMGYTNVKVYREGWPEWTQKNVGVLSAEYLKQAWLDKDIPHVLIDVRPAVEAQAGFIRGRSRSRLAGEAALAGFPDRRLKAPIMVYDADTARPRWTLARSSRRGQSQCHRDPRRIRVLEGRGLSVETGAPATTGGLRAEASAGADRDRGVHELAGATPADTLILDVRNNDEANAGMIKGSQAHPRREILARLAEIPKDQRIVTFCSTGVRAEMAYHKLKEKGYNVAFVRVIWRSTRTAT